MDDATTAPATRRLLPILWSPGRMRTCSTILLIMALCALIGPMLMPESHKEVSDTQYSPPSWQHPFGTDLNGRDQLYRVLSGARISLVVGFSGAMISLVIGAAYGMISGYVGGRVDSVMMRIIDILYAIPRLIFILIFIHVFDEQVKTLFDDSALAGLVPYSRIVILIISLGLIEWLTMARVVRGQVLALKNSQFITAARALGQSHVRILWKHLLPNLSGVIVVYLTLTIPAVILDESFLSFLGLGIQPPQASWGSLLSDAAEVINPVRSYWWLLVFPALAMSITLLAFNFLGDGLRDALDPRKRH